MSKSCVRLILGSKICHHEVKTGQLLFTFVCKIKAFKQAVALGICHEEGCSFKVSSSFFNVTDDMSRNTPMQLAASFFTLPPNCTTFLNSDSVLSPYFSARYNFSYCLCLFLRFYCGEMKFENL